MKLHFRIVFMAVVFIYTVTPKALASDFDKIYNRMYDAYLTNPSKANTTTLLENTNYDGTFRGLNYQSTDGSLRKHTQNMIGLAAAFKNPESAYFNNLEIEKLYLSALKYWVEANHQDQNWWFRYVAYPKELSKSVILMADEIKQDKELLEKTVQYLYWSYDDSDRLNKGRLLGANGADIVIGSMTASLLTQNDEQMMGFKNLMNRLLTIQPVEGIQVDYSFAQHCKFGRQLYFTNYGKEYINSVMYYLEFCDGTKFQPEGVALLQDLFIKGGQWIFFSRHYDPSHTGRGYNTDQSLDVIKSLADRLSKLKIPNRDEMKKISKRIGGENSLEGNRLFWRMDYMINRRANYMTSSRMTSTRTVGNEAGNGAGENNYYTSNGTNYIFVTGREYDRDYYKKLNIRQFPGTTAEQDTAKIPVPYWGENGKNGNAFAGGVSDSIYGACGMILDRRNVKAHKGWFYFDDEFVCLGAGVNESDGKGPVYTTINQCNADGQVEYSQGGRSSMLKEEATLTGTDWVLHGKIGYFDLESKAELKVACTPDLFSLIVNHGINPQNGSYAYLVKPGMKSAKEAVKYKEDIPVEIIANTDRVQAVRHKKLNLVEVIFYQAGHLDLGNGDTISVDAPCAVLLNAVQNKMNIANPRCESENPAVIQVNVTRKGQSETLVFDMPQGEMAGSCVSKNMKGG